MKLAGSVLVLLAAAVIGVAIREYRLKSYLDKLSQAQKTAQPADLQQTRRPSNEPELPSIWEMQIKSQLGKLKLKLPLEKVVESQCKTNNLEVLPIQLEHVLALEGLPTPHKDPFDRLLIAQANVESAILVSDDPLFDRYPVRVIW